MRCFHFETVADELSGIECIRCVDCGEAYVGRNPDTFRLELRLTDELIAEIHLARIAGEKALAA